MGLRAITTVYSYRFPEVRRAVDTVVKRGFPHGVVMGGTNPGGALDNFHRPIVDQVLDFYQGTAPALKGFEHCYPTPASAEGIREVMTILQGRGVEKIYVLDGEYEGYHFVGETRQIESVAVDMRTDFARLEPGYFFISNPFAGNGNILPNELINGICDAGHQVFYDLAYAGATRPHVFDLSHPNIFAAVLSFSKPYGLFYDRVGFTFSREPIPALIGNKWFKSIFALMIAKAVVTELKPQQLYKTYRAIQESIIADINAECGLNMRPSDALLLGRITARDASRLDASQREMIAPFKREGEYRFCLTPYYFERDPERDQLFAEWYAYVLEEPGSVTPEQWELMQGLRRKWLGA